MLRFYGKNHLNTKVDLLQNNYLHIFGATVFTLPDNAARYHAGCYARIDQPYRHTHTHHVKIWEMYVHIINHPVALTFYTLSIQLAIEEGFLFWCVM